MILTHRNLVASDTKILAVLPFFDIYGMTVMMNQGLHRRAMVVTMPKFDLTEFLRVISEYQVDRIYIAPPVAVALAKHPIVDEYDLRDDLPSALERSAQWLRTSRSGWTSRST